MFAQYPISESIMSATVAIALFALNGHGVMQRAYVGCVLCICAALAVFVQHQLVYGNRVHLALVQRVKRSVYDA